MSIGPRVRGTLTEIENHAQRLECTMAELCKAAGIAYSTWWRWNQGFQQPGLGAVDRLMAVTKSKLLATRRQAEAGR